MRRLARLLLLAGTVALVFGVGYFHANFWGKKYAFGSQNSMLAYLAVGLLSVIVTNVVGVIDETETGGSATALSMVSAVVTMGITALLQVFRPDMLPRFVVTTAPLVTIPWILVCWGVARAGKRRQRRRDRVLAVVTPEEATMLCAEAAASFPAPELAFTLAEVVEVDAVLGRAGRTPLIEVANAIEATVVVLSEEAQRHASIVQQAAALHHDGTRIRTVDGFCDEWLGKLPLSSLDRMALLTDIGEVHGGPYVHVKRLGDVLFGVLLGVACVLASPFVALGNRVANRGSLLYSQPRIGLRGRPFMMVKFRTMRPAELKPDTPWTRIEDPRVTAFGRVLRRAHVDELPQFWNILRGDLSLVGPRPEQPQYVEDLRRKILYYDLRHSVKPGLTGWAQIKYRYGSSEADAFEKLQYDLYYLRHQSATFDLRILGRTLRSIVWGRGR